MSAAVALILIAVIHGAAGLGCLSDRGVPVDWFFTSKAPGCADATLPICSPLSYFDGASAPSPRGLYFSNENALGGSALDLTLAQAASARAATARVLWNDDPPCAFNPSSTCSSPSTLTGRTNAHSKGALAGDASGGFWLTHSWPEWPDIRSWAPASGGVANASTIYGQSFLCISLTAAGVDVIADALQRAEPLTYDGFVPSALAAQYPRLVELVGGTRTVTANPTVLQIKSAGGTDFRFFSKNGAWGKELWADLIGPTIALGGEMLVETWRRSPQLPSSCNASTGNVLNVNTVALNVSGALLTKSYTTDHSKYGITAVPSWVCVGDINRMSSQGSRGGGAVCFEEPNLWTTLNSTFTSFDACSSTPLRASRTVSQSTSRTPTPLSGASSNPSSPAPFNAGTTDGLSGPTLITAIVIPCAVAALACVIAVSLRAHLRRQKAVTPLTSRAGNEDVVVHENIATPVGTWRRVHDAGETWYENEVTGASSWTLPAGARCIGSDNADDGVAQKLS
jgi:deoxyribonuclease II